nr:sugar phosphate isomerase/epimerase [Rhodococcus sp. (in: high G+C Gram-positive bacteria)]
MTDRTEGTEYPDLIATCWLSAGDVSPGLADQTSPVPIADRVSMVAESGWAGIGLVYADLISARDGIGYEELGRLIRDAGIGIVEVEFLEGWWQTGAERVAGDALRDDLFAAATALGARHIKVGAGMTDRPLPVATMASAFADLAAQADDAGIRLALEATPFSHIPTTEDAVAVVTASDSPAAGLMIDIWHTFKSGTPHDDLYKIVPIERVAALEIDDGPAIRHTAINDIFLDTINDRKYCGEGDFDTATFVRRTLDAGYTGPWGVEVISNEHRALPVAEGLKRARDTALATFDAAARLS